jgi:hypothetical protein
MRWCRRKSTNWGIAPGAGLPRALAGVVMVAMTDKPDPSPPRKSDKPAPAPPPKLSSQGLRMPANFRDVTAENAGKMFAIIGYPLPPKDEAPAATPDAPERK